MTKHPGKRAARTPPRPPPRGAHRRNRFRIIGGKWRGRRLDFPPLAAVRPSPDRVRETLFNWLAPFIEGARCLDLFAGSGALGLEALSRGAAEVVFVDRERVLVERIRQHLTRLDALAGGRVEHADAVSYLRSAVDGTFDIVFLDPPYGQGLLVPCLRALPVRLKPVNRVYLESEAGSEAALPSGWRLLKSRRAGMVGYHCATFEQASARP